MAFRKHKLFEIFDETSNFLTNKKISVDKSKVNEVYSKLYSPGLSYQGIFSFGIRDFVHVTDSVFELFGEDADTFNIERLLDRIHPDDIEYFLNVNKIAAHFFFKFLDNGGIYVIEDFKHPEHFKYLNNTDNKELNITEIIQKFKKKETFSSELLTEEDQLFLIENILGIKALLKAVSKKICLKYKGNFIE